METLATILIFILFLLSTSLVGATTIDNNIKAKATGNNSSVKVNVENNVNTGTNESEFDSETNTQVNISQEGEGTSSVKINGKEWKLEGPGEINVDESSDSTDQETPTPTEKPTSTETPETDGNLSLTFSEIIKERIEEIKESLQELFSKISNII